MVLVARGMNEAGESVGRVVGQFSLPLTLWILARKAVDSAKVCSQKNEENIKHDERERSA